MRSRLFRAVVLSLALAVIAPLAGIHPAAAQDTCGNAPPARLSTGQSARVTVSDGTGNNLRAAASAAETSTVLGVMADGEIVSVIAGPQCADDFWWWQVRRWDGQTGWTAEGVTGDYWLEPWPAAGAALATGPRPALENALIAYVSGAETSDIFLPYTMEAAGGTVAPLGDVEAGDGALAWAPEGTRVALSDGTDVYVASADGQSLTNLTNLPGTSDLYPVWSPEGTRIAFVSERTGDPEIFSMTAGGQAPLNLTNDAANDIDPAWSPDGTRIAFASDRDGNMEIYTMNAADGTLLQRETTTDADETSPAWSPDGTQIATIATNDGFSDLVVIEDGEPRALTTNANVAMFAWAPDGKRIAYVAETPVGSRQVALFSVRPDGTDLMQYTVNAGEIAGVSWSPDGRWLAFADNRQGTFDLFAIQASGAGFVNLTNSPSFDDVWPHWQPVAAPVTPPGVTGHPADQDLLLIYDVGVPAFTLQNVSGAEVNLAPLSFSGAGVTVPASVWTEYTSSPLESFKSQGCLMIWGFGVDEQPAPPECGDARQGWITSDSAVFWTAGSFTVSYDGAEVATCDTAAGRCDVNLP